MEPFCLLMERTFSEFHPIYDMLQYHCRATLETNKLYDMKFNGKNLKRVRLGFVSGVRVWLVVKVKLGWVGLGIGFGLEHGKLTPAILPQAQWDRSLICSLSIIQHRSKSSTKISKSSQWIMLT